MTNSVSYPYQQIPTNYSGVTIHVNNPSVTSLPNGCLVNPGVNNNQGVNNNLGVNNFQSQCITPNVGYAPNSYQSNPIYAPQYINPTGVNSTGVNPTVVQPAVNSNSNNQPVVPATQYSMVNSQQVPQGYPPEYYMNNYNYMQGQAIPNNNVVEEQSENMDKSKEIIADIDSRIAVQQDLEKNGKQKRVVNLTDEYIMSLENYLNNPNTEIRRMATKEILTRLDEDKTRYDDAALNALVNKMLQDPDDVVRIGAMSALSSGLASGNDFTVQILQNVQNNPRSSKEDVVEAAKILLMMSTDSEVTYVPAKKKEASAPKSDEQAQQIAKMQEQLQKYKQKEIEQQLAQQMMAQQPRK